MEKYNYYYPRRFRFISKEGKPLTDPPIPLFDPFSSDLVEEFIDEDRSDLYGFNMPHYFGVVIKNVLLEELFEKNTLFMNDEDRDNSIKKINIIKGKGLLTKTGKNYERDTISFFGSDRTTSEIKVYINSLCDHAEWEKEEGSYFKLYGRKAHNPSKTKEELVELVDKEFAENLYEDSLASEQFFLEMYIDENTFNEIALGIKEGSIDSLLIHFSHIGRNKAGEHMNTPGLYMLENRYGLSSAYNQGRYKLLDSTDDTDNRNLTFTEKGDYEAGLSGEDVYRLEASESSGLRARNDFKILINPKVDYLIDDLSEDDAF